MRAQSLLFILYFNAIYTITFKNYSFVINRSANHLVNAKNFSNEQRYKNAHSRYFVSIFYTACSLLLDFRKMTQFSITLIQLCCYNYKLKYGQYIFYLA